MAKSQATLHAFKRWLICRPARHKISFLYVCGVDDTRPIYQAETDLNIYVLSAAHLPASCQPSFFSPLKSMKLDAEEKYFRVCRKLKNLWRQKLHRWSVRLRLKRFVLWCLRRVFWLLRKVSSMRYLCERDVFKWRFAICAAFLCDKFTQLCDVTFNKKRACHFKLPSQAV